jgi:two-component system CheB/CheR fusion protein
MVERYAPPSLLLSPDYQLVHLSENAGRYLQHPGGEPSRDIFKLMRPELRIELRTVIFGARERKKLIRSNPVSIVINGEARRVVLSAQYNQDPEREDVILVLFEDFELPEKPEALNHPRTAKEERNFDRIHELENELVETRQRLQSIIEEYETSREEMKASNEELQSSNEELRSTLEELETSKEELQSMNEELSTLNQENRIKVEELRQVSSDLQNLLEATDIATLFLDKEMRIMRFTPQITHLFNIRLADRGRPISDQTHQLGYDALVEDANRVLVKLIPIEREVKDKSGATYLTRILPYRSADDRISGVVITFIDISSRVKAEDKLKQSEAHFRALVEASAQIVWTANAAGELKEDSTSWREFTGQTYQEWKGYGWLKAVHPDDRSSAEAAWKKTVEAQKIMDTTFRLRTQEGDWRWVNIRAVPLFSVDGKMSGFVGMNIDIDERVRNEEAIRQALQEVEQSTRVKEEFLSTMSHEIRTPLNAINGIISLLLKKDPRPDQQENLNTLKFSSQSLLMLINDILDFSKIEAGKMEISEDNYSLETLLNSLHHAHTPGAEEMGNDFILSREDDVPLNLRGDSYKLSQVLNNLIGNANKFTENGQIKLSVKLEKKAGDMATLYFEVADTGIGISEDKLEKIFDKFTQADSSTVRKFGGTGLGLSITKSLLELMGSDIKVESIEGKGARFYFVLQQQIVGPAKKEQAKALKLGDGDIDAAVRQTSILLVEDAAINRLVMQQYLHEWWEKNADEAQNGHEALEKATNKQYDLILMDIRMPGMGGVEATRQIRQLNTHYQSIPILAITADVKIHGLKEDEEDLFTDMISKPYQPEELELMIKKYVGAEINPPETHADDRPKPADGPLPDFEKVEKQFAESPKKTSDFLKIAERELREFNEAFFAALAENHQQQMSEILHKARVLFDLLGINSLLEEIRSLRDQADTLTADSPAVVAARSALQRCIASVQKYQKRGA